MTYLSWHGEISVFDKLLMIIPFQQTTFLKSAAQLSQLPPDEGIEIAFVGRSNAGKSTALNTITGIKGLAKTSKTPGRTQLINLFEVTNKLRLVDLPGYGYAQVPLEIKLRWQKTLSIYLQKRKCLIGLYLLMDIRHPLQEFDLDIIEWGISGDLRIHILLTKADKLSHGAANNVLFKVKNALNNSPLISYQIFSALKGIGIDEARKKLGQWANQSIS